MIRSVLAIVVGIVIAIVVILAIQMINTINYGPHPEKPLPERIDAIMKMMKEDPRAMNAWVESLPVEAMITVLVSYVAGAFVGGLIAALIAARSRVFHAAIIGVLVLAATIFNFIDMKQRFDFSHPDWMIVAALLLPIPVSLIAGMIASALMPGES